MQPLSKREATMTAKKAVPAFNDLGKKDEETPVTTGPDHTPLVSDEEFDQDEDYDDDEDENFLSPHVVSTVPNKTPAELAAETPDETDARYGKAPVVSQEDLDNPRVQVYKDTVIKQVPSGTHLHPDIARDMFNRGISDSSTDNAQVRRITTDTYDFAPDAETNDKWQKPDNSVRNYPHDADDYVTSDDKDGTHKL